MWVLQEKEPRLPGLLKMLVWAQDHLDEKLIYPVRPQAASSRPKHIAPLMSLPTCDTLYHVMVLATGLFTGEEYGSRR